MLPPEVAARYGIAPGMRIRVDEAASGLKLLRPSRLMKLYIEPTNQCNLDCRTCMRNVWEEPLGMMSDAVFDRVIEGLKAFSPPPTVFFGGFGEPLFHPRIVEMVRRAKALGSSVEMITNATLLTPALSKELIDAGLDMLWVSLDGASPDSYADIRLGAEFPQVVKNIAAFRDAVRAEGSIVRSVCGPLPIFKAELGVEFVAMKRNIADLSKVLKLGLELGASRFIVTHVLPYTKEMSEQALYPYLLRRDTPYPHLKLPRTEDTGITDDLVFQVMHNMNLSWAGHDAEDTRERCPFIESGSGAISWEGGFSPCLPLMHSHTSYLVCYQRYSKRYVVGNVMEKGLYELWNDPEHIAFRERVQSFDFAPCTTCGGCELSESNEEDCAGNVFPTCGGCLWARGLIQCP